MLVSFAAMSNLHFLGVNISQYSLYNISVCVRVRGAAFVTGGF